MDLPGGDEAWVEQELAREAFRKELRLPTEMGEDDCRASLEMLNTLYTRQGWSSGMHQTEEMVRRFASAATEQARALGGSGR